MLDELMGKERDLPPEERTGKGISYKDKQICKYALAGLCPYGLFKNTKSDLGMARSQLLKGSVPNSLFILAAVKLSASHQTCFSGTSFFAFPGLCKYEVHEDDVEFEPAKEEWDGLPDSEKERYHTINCFDETCKGWCYL